MKVNCSDISLEFEPLGYVQLKRASMNDFRELQKLVQTKSAREFCERIIGHQMKFHDLSLQDIQKLSDDQLLQIARAYAKEESYLFPAFPNDGDFEDVKRCFQERVRTEAKKMEKSFPKHVRRKMQLIQKMNEFSPTYLKREHALRKMVESAYPSVHQISSQISRVAEEMKRISDPPILRMVQQFTEHYERTFPPWMKFYRDLETGINAALPFKDLANVAALRAFDRTKEIALHWQRMAITDMQADLLRASMRNLSAFESLRESTLNYLGNVTSAEIIVRELSNSNVASIAASEYPTFLTTLPYGPPLRMEREIYDDEVDIEKDEIAQKLKEKLGLLSPHFPNMIREAWKLLNSSHENNIRSAAHLMRELVREVLTTLAPDDCIKDTDIYDRFKSKDHDNVTRKMRIEYALQDSKKEKKFICTIDKSFLLAWDKLNALAHIYNENIEPARCYMSMLQTMLYYILINSKYCTQLSNKSSLLHERKIQPSC